MLKIGEVIIFPTDTVYGMGCSAFDLRAQKRMYEIKNRPEEKRFSVLFSSIDEIKEFAIIDERAEKLMKKFFPGGLTLILNTNPKIKDFYVFNTMGVRIPNHPLAKKLLEENGPMANSSVNISGSEPLNDYDEIVKNFQDKVDKIYPNDMPLEKVSSTVIDLTKEEIGYIREGNIKFSEIEEVLANEN